VDLDSPPFVLLLSLCTVHVSVVGDLLALLTQCMGCTVDKDSCYFGALACFVASWSQWEALLSRNDAARLHRIKIIFTSIVGSSSLFTDYKMCDVAVGYDVCTRARGVVWWKVLAECLVGLRSAMSSHRQRRGRAAVPRGRCVGLAQPSSIFL